LHLHDIFLLLMGGLGDAPYRLRLAIADEPKSRPSFILLCLLPNDTPCEFAAQLIGLGLVSFVQPKSARDHLIQLWIRWRQLAARQSLWQMPLAAILTCTSPRCG
jgi:hypothetical protein